jgi:hypothetical protein
MRTTVGYRNVLLLVALVSLVLAAAAFYLDELVSLWQQFAGFDVEVGL